MDMEAARLFGAGTPVVAAVQGAAIGAGFGLACLADFRVGSPEARFAANFARLGYHHILGLTITLPAIVGQQHALSLLYTGRRLKGEEALAIGLCDRLVAADELRAEAHAHGGGDRRQRTTRGALHPPDHARRPRRAIPGRHRT